MLEMGDAIQSATRSTSRIFRKEGKIAINAKICLHTFQGLFQNG